MACNRCGNNNGACGCGQVMQTVPVIGPPGPTGPRGESFNICGVVNSVADLPRMAECGDTYLSSQNSHLWVWDCQEFRWFDAGPIRGPIGPAGKDGPTGPTGPHGAQGKNGDTAYELATQSGFVGSLQEWLNSLHGAPGSPGAVGPIGATGPQGPAGRPINFLGEVKDQGSLPSIPIPTHGDAYTDQKTGHIWVWNSYVGRGGAWEDGGRWRGPIGPTGAQGPEVQLINPVHGIAQWGTAVAAPAVGVNFDPKKPAMRIVAYVDPDGNRHEFMTWYDPFNPPTPPRPGDPDPRVIPWADLGDPQNVMGLGPRDTPLPPGWIYVGDITGNRGPTGPRGDALTVDHTFPIPHGQPLDIAHINPPGAMCAVQQVAGKQAIGFITWQDPNPPHSSFMILVTRAGNNVQHTPGPPIPAGALAPGVPAQDVPVDAGCGWGYAGLIEGIMGPTGPTGPMAQLRAPQPPTLTGPREPAAVTITPAGQPGMWDLALTVPRAARWWAIDVDVPPNQMHVIGGTPTHNDLIAVTAQPDAREAAVIARLVDALPGDWVVNIHNGNVFEITGP